MVIRVATFNVALARTETGALLRDLKQGDAQARAVADVIQFVQPDLLLLNEFDWDETGVALTCFCQNYLNSGNRALDYPYHYAGLVNTGYPSGRDFDKDGYATDKGADALGFGDFPGQYGMVLLSRYPIQEAGIRTFRSFRWTDMPDANLPKHPQTGAPWFDTEDLAVLPLSSKSHWDIPVQTPNGVLRLLCSHPTPPVFDGEEKRNQCRNHDEIRFWTDYLSNRTYPYDDQGVTGGYISAGEAPFVLLGDLNASPDEGESSGASIRALLQHPDVQGQVSPVSIGAEEHSPGNPFAKSHTAQWRLRADYALASSQLSLQDQAVFWPSKTHPLHRSVCRASDHRLVYVDVNW